MKNPVGERREDTKRVVPNPVWSIETPHVESQFLRRAVEATGSLARRRGILGATERMLQRADLPLSAAEFLFLYGALTIILAPLWFIITGNILFGILGHLAVMIVPLYVIAIRLRRRAEHIDEQLPDAIAAIATSMKAGMSLRHAFEIVARETEEPLGRELRRVVTETRLGWPLTDALDDAASRIGSQDFAWTVLAIRIQSQVGGTLTDVLDAVGETMQSRLDIRGEVTSLTAEGRSSAIILSVLPVIITAVMYVVNRDYISILFDRTAGRALLGTCAVLIAIGYGWMKRISDVDY